MLCELCGKNEASIHITKIVNGVKKEANICSKCAGKTEGFNLTSDMDIMTSFSFQNILGGLMDYVNTSKNNTIEEVKCKNCGAFYREFKEKGLLGCSECYKYFSPAILSVVRGVQGNIEHVGKIPKKLGKDLIHKQKILNLKEQLQNAIALEEYEKAAEIRDKIKEIEKKNAEE